VGRKGYENNVFPMGGVDSSEELGTMCPIVNKIGLVLCVVLQWCEQFLCCYAPEITKFFISSSNFFISSVDF
jgi:hypothetical protein